MHTFHGLLVSAAPAATSTHAAVRRAEWALAFWAERARRAAVVAAAAIGRALADWQRMRELRATQAALASLDSATLRDLGLHDGIDGLREYDNRYANRAI